VARISNFSGSFPRFTWRTDVEVLGWQNRLRYAVVAITALVALAARQLNYHDGVRPQFFVALGIFVIAVRLTHAIASHKRSVAKCAVLCAGLLDMAVICLATAFGLPATMDEGALIFSFLAITFTDKYYGRAPAWVGAVAATLGFGILKIGFRGATSPQQLVDVGWYLAVFITCTVTYMVVHMGFNARMDSLVDLFARASEGDWNDEYDVLADKRPDGITLIGRAYNRMRSELHALLLQDPLSGCLNRRGLDREMAPVLARAQRSFERIGVLAIDIDRFKEVNDTFGHAAGDSLIKHIGALLRGIARRGDLVGRQGGDEFVVVMPDTSGDGARLLAERILIAVRGLKVPELGNTQLSASVGVVVHKIEIDTAWHELMDGADGALYAAKRGGRNRLVAIGGPPSVTAPMAPLRSA
jgi:diguanylate cyclase (GGDEF)-like protein